MKNFSFAAIAAALLIVFPNTIFAAGAKPAFPSWSQKLPTKRFTVLTAFDGAAVLDNETGLVWQQAPSGSEHNWLNAVAQCFTIEVGGRLGWRLPTIQELASLMDKSQDPALPVGHPFTNVHTNEGDFYWSSTTFQGPGVVVAFQSNGIVTGVLKSETGFFWCVRGGSGAEE